MERQTGTTLRGNIRGVRGDSHGRGQGRVRGGEWGGARMSNLL